MAATERFDRTSPECGWAPFVDWLAGQGIKPADARDITIEPETLTAEVTLLKHRLGKRYVDSTGSLATKTKKVRLTSRPPLHPSRRGGTG